MNANDIIAADAATLATAYRTGALSPVDVIEVVLEVAQTRGRELNAIAAIDSDRAREAAAGSAARWHSGDMRGPLDGVPVSVKDSLPVTGLKRWHGSRINDSLPASIHDGAPVRRLRESGAVVFAKTAMPDFGLLGSGVSSQFGITRNPWNESTSPGGSSSGSAALLAIGGGPLSVGTDMGGSVRFPAALNGLTAVKPTQGRVAYDPPKLIGTAGPMARTVADLAALLSVIGQTDDADHLSLPGRFAWERRGAELLAGARIGVLVAGESVLTSPDIVEAVRMQAELLAAAGATLVEISQPLLSEDELRVLVAVLMTRGLPELASAPSEFWQELPAPLRQVLSDCLSLSAVDHVRNEKRVETMRASAAGVLNSFDFVLSPVAPMTSFPAASTRPTVNGRDVGDENLIFTAPHNITGLPAGVLCAAVAADGTPIGVQVSGRRFDDGGVLSILAFLEDAREFVVDFPYARV